MRRLFNCHSIDLDDALNFVSCHAIAKHATQNSIFYLPLFERAGAWEKARVRYQPTQRSCLLVTE